MAWRLSLPLFIAKGLSLSGTTIGLHVGGVDIDDEGEVPADSLPVIRGCWWVGHEVDLYTSCFLLKKDLEWWVDRSCVVWCVKDARLIRLAVCKENERVYHGKGSSTEDFFFLYTYLFFLDVRSSAFHRLPIGRLTRPQHRPHLTPFEWVGLHAGLRSGLLRPGNNSNSSHFPSLLQRPSACKTRMGVPDFYGE